VRKAAKVLAIPVGAKVKALLDAAAVRSRTARDETSVPLRGLGLGSTRLLFAGLQRQVTSLQAN
jgi:putative ATP-dependent endonuclease of OLD family